MNYAPEAITDCDGCRTEGDRLFAGCKLCPIRKCAREKEFDSCADCGEYACEQLKALLAREPTARAQLDELRRNIH